MKKIGKKNGYITDMMITSQHIYKTISSPKIYIYSIKINICIVYHIIKKIIKGVMIKLKYYFRILLLRVLILKRNVALFWIKEVVVV